MARRKPTADRLSVRMAKMAGARLSAEELENGDDLLGDDQPTPIAAADGKLNMEALLARLLQALGITVPDTSEAGFKTALMEAALRKIEELTGKGTAAGGTSSADANANPLIQQAQHGGGGGASTVEPMYLSLSHIARLPDQAKQIALSLATQLARVNHDRRVAAKANDRQMEARLSEARSKRQEQINRLLRLAPHLRGEVDRLLNAPSAAFSVDTSGNTRDPAEAALATLERRVMQQNPHLTSIQASGQRIELPAPSEDAAVAALSRFMLPRSA